MKRAHSKSLIVLATVIGLGVATVSAATCPQVASARNALKNQPAMEMPAKAAQMVAEAKAEDRESTAACVVTAALDLRPASTLPVVGAIASRSPEAAAATAAKAAAMQPKKLAEIAAAAAAAAPSQAGQIVEALCKAAPAKYALIASSVSRAVPSASKEIVSAVKAAVPSVKPFVERAAGDLAQDATVAAIMLRTELLQSSGSQTAQAKLASIPPGPVGPPTVGEPYNPLPGGPELIYTPGSARPVPAGGDRDYSLP